MNPKRKAPLPILDNLDPLDNPFQQQRFSATPYLDKPVRGAATDLEYVLKFLYSYRGSPATYHSYRRELERLLQWAWRIEAVSVLTLKREQIEAFIQFCGQPPLAWIGTKQVPRFLLREGERVANPAWRPFVTTVTKADFQAGAQADPKHYAPSQAAIKASFTVLSSFYAYLVQEGRLGANPVALIRQKSRFVRKDQLKPPIRRISTLQWDYVLESAEQMAQANPQEHERTLFIMHCLFAMYLRISELVADARSTPLMSHFRKDQDGHWWFHVTGKGNKQRTVTVCDAMLKALKRYRQALGLSPLPAPTEQIPLIASHRGQGPVTSTRHIRRLVQACFDAAYRRMLADGLEADALELKTATVHWLRHTGISEDVKIRPREHVRDDAGHASMATTDHYVESDQRERHASGRRKRIKDF